MAAQCFCGFISIHASLVGGDGPRSSLIETSSTISIHASLVGGDSGYNPYATQGCDFNPRLPRGRRLAAPLSFLSRWDFNPRLPRGRRRYYHVSLADSNRFQSTPPSWEATISFPVCCPRYRHFNPRLPRGRRQRPRACGRAANSFQSTPPSWEATSIHVALVGPPLISIHASLVGGDSERISPPWRIQISIHASLVGGDRRRAGGRGGAAAISIHASLVGGDLRKNRILRNRRFQSTPPSWEATTTGSGTRAGGGHFNPRLPRGRRHWPSTPSL